MQFLANRLISVWLIIGSFVSLCHGSNGSSTVLRAFQCSNYYMYVLDKSEFRQFAYYGQIAADQSYDLILPMSHHIVAVHFVRFFHPHLFLVRRSSLHNENDCDSWNTLRRHRNFFNHYYAHTGVLNATPVFMSSRPSPLPPVSLDGSMAQVVQETRAIPNTCTQLF